MRFISTLVLALGYMGASLQGQNSAPLNLSGVEIQSALVIDVASGDTLWNWNQQKRMTPASLTKLFTTVAAFDLLKHDFHYETTCFLDNDSNRLIIKGGGDPSLGSSFFDNHSMTRFIDRILNGLKNSNVSSLSGGITIDLSYFGRVLPPSPRLWEDLGNYFGALPSSLTVNDNTFRLFLDSPLQVGSRCTVSGMIPQWGALPKSLVVASAGTADSAYIYGIADCDNWYVSGSIPAGRKKFAIKGAMPDPHRWFADELQRALNKEGFGMQNINFNYKPVVTSRNPLVVVSSPSLTEICRVVNKNSNNLYADHLFLTLGKTIGRPDWDGGVEVLERYCRQQLNVTTANFYDGSGLSPFNGCSVANVVMLLRHAKGTPFFDDFYESLPISGVDGTIRNMWRNSVSKGRIRAKSGSMNGVLGYAGYVKTHHDRLLAFCVLVNHHTEKNTVVRHEIEKWLSQFLYH